MPVVDTSLSLGVGPVSQFTDEDLDGWLTDGGIDVQIAYQPDECFYHRTPGWNPFLGNDYIAEVQARHPGRLIGLATVQAWHQAPLAGDTGVTESPALDEVERCIVELGLGGLRMNPLQHNYQFNHQHVVWPLLDRLTAVQERVGRQLIVSVHAYGDSLNNSPEALVYTANRYPALLFLMQHCGFVWGYGTVNDVVVPHDNLLLDLSTMPQRAVVWEAYERLGPGRFCIGADGPMGTSVVKRAIVADFARSDHEAAMILGDNLAKRLGLSEASVEER
jgi:predicted TIM-barrel fold metal-dependent hydrolase